MKSFSFGRNAPITTSYMLVSASFSSNILVDVVAESSPSSANSTTHFCMSSLVNPPETESSLPRNVERSFLNVLLKYSDVFSSAISFQISPW